MSRDLTIPVNKTALLFTIIYVLVVSSTAATTMVYRLDNGMEIILKENHASPMVSSLVFVRSGSKYESRFENGITHLLEHLLFDGTVNLSRLQLDGAISNLGGYINAFTRQDMTAYLVLLPRQYIDYGMTVQADMLFNSTIPENELAKERKVVVEEINSGDDSPGAPADAHFREMAYANTPYARPVLGYKAFIENIPRSAVIDYWKKYYRPSNMTLLVIGDFESDMMKQAVATIFGSIPDSANGFDTMNSNRLAPVAPLTGQQRYDTVGQVRSTHINFSIAAPPVSDSTYLAFDLLARYVDMDEVSPLKRALMSDSPLASEVSVSLATYAEFCRFEVSIVTEDENNRDTIVATVVDQIRQMSKHAAGSEVIEGIKVSARTQELFMSEKLHYYGFMIAPRLFTTGWDRIQSYVDRLDALNWNDCRIAAGQWLDDPNFIVTTMMPADSGHAGAVYRTVGLTEDEVVSYFDTAAIQQWDSLTSATLVYPSTDSVSFELVDRAEYFRDELANGMSVIVKSSPDSRVFAVNILGRNRSGHEPKGKAGSVDFVNRCIEKGTMTRSAAELSRDLAAIGANLTLYDNPWIPYDDRYTTRRFSFVKFETIDDYAEKGFHLLAEIILHPAFDSVEVGKVRQQMLGIIGRNAGSPGKVSSNLLFETMFRGHPYARPIMGTAETIGSITIDDLRAVHASQYAPENMVLSIVTNRPVPQVMDWVEKQFGRLVAAGGSAAQPLVSAPSIVADSSHRELASEQISIRLGSLLPGADHPDATIISVAAAILSERLYHSLREKQGLAYSVGASALFDVNFGWFYSSIGTGAENRDKALDGLLLEFEKLKFDGPTRAEVNRARNRIWGRLMSSKLSRINQAYYLGVGEYLERPADSDRRLLEELSRVTSGEIRRVATKYFCIDGCVKVSAGSRP